MLYGTSPYLIGLVLHRVIFGKGITGGKDISTLTVFGFSMNVFTLEYIVDNVTPKNISRTNSQISLQGK